MSRFRPSVTFYRDERSVESFRKNTFKELLKAIRDKISEVDTTNFTICRSRRGEWGEWFENYVVNGNKFIKIKEGWM